MWSNQEVTGKMIALYFIAPLSASIISTFVNSYLVESIWLRALIYTVVLFIVFALGFYLNETQKEKKEKNDN
ncbi:hypothetical protein SAMN02910293_02043 [Streptococcus henryi]|uniref:Uncharacterized protein n=2 Tax=Streptococcus henryi TaxID=439219 RepID=A0A1G6D939_9STRE|nr:hypothetical protein SAMN02910293_02043 [Streptococcus henryi]